jgi:hypothetical protein
MPLSTTGGMGSVDHRAAPAVTELFARQFGVSRAGAGVLIAIALLAVLVPALLVRFGPVMRATPRRVIANRAPARVVPPAELPPVEPVAIENVDPDQARAFNAGVPFVDGPNPAARPFRLADTTEDALRATDCLAAAAYYEAGDDAVGERAVVQVVINRLRHPAFPKTVCGVVFQGSERSTGCQFTFTCDGSIARRQPSPVAWTRARDIAASALHGSVYAPVGWATHYHADFVVPYWQASLDKLAEVHTQLFYRWTGWWGTAGAFRGRPLPAEPIIGQLAAFSEAHRAEEPMPGTVADDATVQPDAAPPAGRMIEEGSFLVALPKDAPPDSYPALAAAACGDRPFCRYLAWRDQRAVPPGLPLDPGQIATLGYSYVRDRSSGYERSSWNCREVARRDQRECMRPQVLLSAAPVETLPAKADAGGPGASGDLVGVRRKGADPAGSAVAGVPAASPAAARIAQPVQSVRP